MPVGFPLRVLAHKLLGLLLVAAMGTIFSAALLAQPQNAVSISNESSQKLSVVNVPEMGNFQFVTLGDLAEKLDLRTFYSEKAHKAILYVGSNELKITAMNPFVQINGRMVQMPLETRFANGDILVPLQYFAALLRPLYPNRWPEELEFRPAAEQINNNPSSFHNASTTIPQGSSLEAQGSSNVSASTAIPIIATAAPPRPDVPRSISKILVEEKANGTLIRLQTTAPFTRKQVNTRVSQKWLYIDVIGGRLDSGAVRYIRPAGIVQRVVPMYTGTVAQISCLLKENIDQKRIIVIGQGNEILISLPRLEPLSKEVLRNLETERRKWLIDTIVLDAGHGGHDPGAIGPNGVKEKDITLAVAKRVKRLLEKNLDLRIVMTRDNDRFMPLKDRTQMANSAQGKLFISIHCNANLSNRVNGATTYFLGPARTEEALEVARRENSVIRYEADSSAYAGLGAEGFILTAMAQNSFNRESQDLAGIIQDELGAAIKIPNRGVKQAGYYVLVGASMPNILIETAFISHPREEAMLDDAGFQQDVAEAIFNGIKKFKEKYEWGI